MWQSKTQSYLWQAVADFFSPLVKRTLTLTKRNDVGFETSGYVYIQNLLLALLLSLFELVETISLKYSQNLYENIPLLCKIYAHTVSSDSIKPRYMRAGPSWLIWAWIEWRRERPDLLWAGTVSWSITLLDIFQTRPAGTQLFSSADLPVCGLSSCNDGDLLDRCVITVNEGRTIQHGLFLEMPWRRWVRILFFTTFSVNFEYIKRAMQTLSTVLLYTEDVNHSRFTKSYFN